MVVKLLHLFQRLSHQVFQQRLEFSFADLYHARVQMLAVRREIFAVEPARQHGDLRV